MIRRFYGVYLADRGISTVLDLIRFLGEPDSTRFSHITLRGPYYAQLSKVWLDSIARSGKYKWEIEFTKPGTFFTDRQSTVVIGVSLLTLQDIFYKKDYPDGLPHITLYDGKSRSFAEALSALVAKYDWGVRVPVTQIREIERNQKIDQTFIPFYLSFQRYFAELIGDPDKIKTMHTVSAEQRLKLIESILERCTVPPSSPTRMLQPHELLAAAGSAF